jgi:hypothetical protein
MILRFLLICISVVVLAGCATPYQSSGATGGFKELQLQTDIWRVSYSGNGYTTYETVQTYWLYRCAELARSQGFDGFQVLSDVRFARSSQLDLIGLRGESPYPLLIAAGGPVYIPIYTPSNRQFPAITADIKLLKKPFEHNPPKIFDADILKDALEKYVMGEKCDRNVCPHVHEYVFPVGTLTK